MMDKKKEFSIGECASVCGVSRGTVHYWLKTDKLSGFRSGKNYRIFSEELLHFLRSTKRPIPEVLHGEAVQRPLFGPLKACWEHLSIEECSRCTDCLVYVQKMPICIEAKALQQTKCEQPCHLCRYYLDVLFPRIHFIHQIKTPVAIYRDFYILAGNRPFAEICGIEESELPGLGIEKIIHPNSLGEILVNTRKLNFGALEGAQFYQILLSTRHNGEILAHVAVYPLNEPDGAYLVMGKETPESHAAAKNSKKAAEQQITSFR